MTRRRRRSRWRALRGAQGVFTAMDGDCAGRVRADPRATALLPGVLVALDASHRGSMSRLLAGAEYLAEPVVSPQRRLDRDDCGGRRHQCHTCQAEQPPRQDRGRVGGLAGEQP